MFVLELRVCCNISIYFFTFCFVVYLVAFIGLHIVNRKETLKLVHLLQFCQGGKAISGTRQMGNRSRGILLMRLLLVYLKIDLSIRDAAGTGVGT